MQTYGPTLRMMETSSVGEVTSTETHRFVFLARMIEMSRFARRFSVFDASDSYEAIETQGVVTGGQHTNSIKNFTCRNKYLQARVPNKG